jgi:type III secretory pathway component EscU
MLLRPENEARFLSIKFVYFYLSFVVSEAVLNIAGFIIDLFLADVVPLGVTKLCMFSIELDEHSIMCISLSEILDSGSAIDLAESLKLSLFGWWRRMMSLISITELADESLKLCFIGEILSILKDRADSYFPWIDN